MFKSLGAALPVVFLSFFANSAEALTSTYKLDALSQKRSATIHIPDSVIDAGATAPVVFAFHGPGSSAITMEWQTKILDEADAKGFIVVMPNGTQRENFTGLYWNVAPFLAPDEDYALMSDEDFVMHLLDYLDEREVADRSRVYAAGFSMGGMMAYKLGCTMPEVFSAVAVVSGAMTTEDCAPGLPVSLFHLHGMQDNRIPYAGGEAFAGSGRSWPSVMEEIRTWKARQSCGPDRSFPIEDEGICFVSSCGDGQEVQHCISYEGGHEWAGKTQSVTAVREYGETPSLLKATPMVFDFLEGVPGRPWLDLKGVASKEITVTGLD